MFTRGGELYSWCAPLSNSQLDGTDWVFFLSFFTAILVMQSIYISIFFQFLSLLFIYLFIFCCCCCWNRKSVYRHCAHTGSCCTETALLQRLSIKSESKDAPSSHVDAGYKTVRSFLELPSFRILLLGFQAEHFLPGPESFLNRRPSALICMKRKRERADQLGWIWLESLSFQHRSGCLSSDN